MLKFLERRIGDHRILRLIRKWLTAGVSEDGQWSKTTVGTPQGAVRFALQCKHRNRAPLLANVYLHYVLDLWIEWWRTQRHGNVVIVRYADDFVIGFERLADAEACLKDLQIRFAKFGLKLHESKTRLIEFGKYAAERRDRRGAGRPETFDFPGFTHKCARTRKTGWFTIHRHSIAKRMRATFQKIKTDLQKRRHHRLGDTGRWLRRVVQGWLNYHAVPSNSQSLCRFIDEVTRLWLSEIRKRSQRGRSGWTWERMQRLVRLHLPRPRVTHPYPNERFRARLKVGAV